MWEFFRCSCHIKLLQGKFSNLDNFVHVPYDDIKLKKIKTENILLES